VARKQLECEERTAASSDAFLWFYERSKWLVLVRYVFSLHPPHHRALSSIVFPQTLANYRIVVY
jgi:hypothetical protein